MVIKSKKAIAMIELIFALVIMGIVLMSAPMLIQQSIKSSNVALQQEAIVATASHTSLLLSMYWDEKNTPNEENASDTNYGEILDINRTNDSNFTYPDRNNSSLRSISSSIITATINTHANHDNNETDIFEFDDVDDFNDEPFGLMLFNDEISNSDYVDTNITISTSVNFAEDRLQSGLVSNILDINLTSTTDSTNIKFITVNLISNYVEELNKSITMKAFSCNIGQYSIDGEIK